MNSYRPAGRLRRLLATMIDAALVPALTILLIMLTNVMEDAEDYQTNAWMFHVLGLAILSYLLLNGVSLWRRGQTIGKLLTNIQIVRSNDPTSIAPIWKLILIRAWFFPLLFLAIVPWLGLIALVDQIFIFSKSRRCLHDYLAGTRVIRIPRNP